MEELEYKSLFRIAVQALVSIKLRPEEAQSFAEVTLRTLGAPAGAILGKTKKESEEWLKSL